MMCLGLGIADIDRVDHVLTQDGYAYALQLLHNAHSAIEREAWHAIYAELPTSLLEVWVTDYSPVDQAKHD